MDIDKRMSDLIVISGRLAEILEIENEALSHKRPESVRNLLEEKNTLARVYESRMKTLRENVDEFDEADPDLRERLVGLSEKIKELADRNSRLLKIAIESNRRVVKLVAEAVKEAQPGPSVYGSNGTMGYGGNAKVRHASLTLDRTL